MSVLISEADEQGAHSFELVGWAHIARRHFPCARKHFLKPFGRQRQKEAASIGKVMVWRARRNAHLLGDGPDRERASTGPGTLRGLSAFLWVFPIIFMALNLAFIGYLIRALSKKRWSLLKNGLRMGTLFIVGYLIVNFAFSIFATPIVLRYQIVPMILLFTFSALLMDGLETPRTLKYISKK